VVLVRVTVLVVVLFGLGSLVDHGRLGADRTSLDAVPLPTGLHDLIGLGRCASGPGNGAERPARIPRSISSLRAGLPAEAVSWQLQLRAPNGFGSAPIGFGSALADAAPPTLAPRTIAALTSIFFAITRLC
jgi:hypothetical protein